jgi:hypothetical protein
MTTPKGGGWNLAELPEPAIDRIDGHSVELSGDGRTLLFTVSVGEGPVFEGPVYEGTWDGQRMEVRKILSPEDRVTFRIHGLSHDGNAMLLEARAARGESPSQYSVTHLFVVKRVEGQWRFPRDFVPDEKPDFNRMLRDVAMSPNGKCVATARNEAVPEAPSKRSVVYLAAVNEDGTLGKPQEVDSTDSDSEYEVGGISDAGAIVFTRAPLPTYLKDAQAFYRADTKPGTPTIELETLMKKKAAVDVNRGATTMP